MKIHSITLSIFILVFLFTSCQKEERPWDYNIDISPIPLCSMGQIDPYQTMYAYNDSRPPNTIDSMYSQIIVPLEYHCSGLYRSGEILFLINAIPIFEVKYGSEEPNAGFWGIQTTYLTYDTQNPNASTIEKCLFHQQGGCLIRNYLYYKCGDIELATDLTQDVFLRIWHKKLPLKEPHVKPLLYKIAKDTWVSYVRKVTTEQKYLDRLTLLSTIEEPSEYNETLKQAYEKGLAQLPEKQRTAFLMSRLEGLTYKEISIRLEISSKAVEKRIQKALKTFRQVLSIIRK